MSSVLKSKIWSAVPLLVAYHLVRVNYGEIAGPEAAEVFGATLCGMDVDDYYAALQSASKASGMDKDQGSTDEEADLDPLSDEPDSVDSGSS